MSDSHSGDTEHELTVTFEDGQAKQIRSNLRLVGSDAVFEVNGSTAKLVATVRGDGEHTLGAVDEVKKLPFIDDVILPPRLERTQDSDTDRPEGCPR